VPEERLIKFRIGVNLGDVIVEEHDIFGDGVNLTARLEALAEPGEICVMSQTRRCVPWYGLEDHAHMLEGLSKAGWPEE
jgi:class 3 adenylate cyclase